MVNHVLLVPYRTNSVVEYLPDTVLAVSLMQIKSGKGVKRALNKLDSEGVLIRWGVSLTLSPAWKAHTRLQDRSGSSISTKGVQ